MPALVAGIHLLLFPAAAKTWMTRVKPGHDACRSFPVPAAGPEPLMHVRRGGRRDADRLLVLRDRNCDFARMQMQPRLAEPRSVAVDVVAHDRPALGRRMHAELM